MRITSKRLALADEFNISIRNNYVSKRIALAKEWLTFDRIVLTGEQACALVETISDTPYFSPETLLNPSIPEFCALLNNTENPTQSTYICYRKTCMNRDDFSTEEWRGMKLGFQPVIDAYVYMNNKGTHCNFVVTFCRGELLYEGKIITNLTPLLTYQNDDPFTDALLSDDENMHLFMQSIEAAYLAVQRLSIERPEVIANAMRTTTQTVEIKKPKHKRKEKPKRIHKTHLVKVIRITNELIQSLKEKLSRVFNCPCWGVAGHMRTYKSGRQIWIKPYRKGRERLNPNAYEPKEYLIPTKEEIINA